MHAISSLTYFIASRAIFGVGEGGGVYFQTAVPDSSAGEAQAMGKLKTGDLLASIDSHVVLRQSVSFVASKLLGRAGTYTEVEFQRHEEVFKLRLKRRIVSEEARTEALNGAFNSYNSLRSNRSEHKRGLSGTIAMN